MPRTVSLDLRGTPPVTGGFFDRIPPDHYRFSVAQVEEVQSSTGKRMWKLSAKVARGPQAGAMVGDNFVLEDNNGAPSKVGLGRLHFLLLCLDLPVGEKAFKLDLDNLTGREFEADVVDEEYTNKNGATSTSSKISKYYLPGQTKSANGNGTAAPTTPVSADVGGVESTPFETEEVAAVPAEIAAVEDEVEDIFK